MDYKAKIKNAVALYKKIYPEEYKKVCEQIETNRRLMYNDFAAVSIEGKQLERAMYEIPETLYFLIRKNIDEVGQKFISSKEGMLWFAKNFREFSLAKRI